VTESPIRTVADDFRTMMRGFPTGVAVVTATTDTGHPIGMTCSSLCSVSLDPPTLLVCLRDGGATLDAVLSRKRFSVNLLLGTARSVAELFASTAPDRFAHVHWEHGSGPHLPLDAHAIADCRVVRTELVGDHVVVFGEVDSVSVQGGRPLLYGQREYQVWPPR
jgi:flavin reductase (DIM6/NTAB) family NADH-FMN oxidoreductase RutF